MLLQKLRSGLIGYDEVLPKNKVVDLIREYDLVERHVLSAQLLNEGDHLAEGHIAVVDSLNEQDLQLAMDAFGEEENAICLASFTCGAEFAPSSHSGRKSAQS
jgi:hypothetical protein